MPEWTQKRTRACTAHFKQPFRTVHILLCITQTVTMYMPIASAMQVNSEHLPAGWSRDRIMQEINALNVPCLWFMLRSIFGTRL